MPFTTQFLFQAGDSKQQITGIADAMRAVGERTKTSATDIALYTAYLKRSVEAGNTVKVALSGLGKAFEDSSGSTKRFIANLREYIGESKKAEEQAKHTENAFSRIAVMFAGQQTGLPIP